MVNVSLNNSMRVNLYNLQQIAEQQALVQNRLAEGLKVNSAIQNASSYYTAVSLSSQVNDLNLLMDSISQSVFSLKNSVNAIDTAIKFLETAEAAAHSALDNINAQSPPVTPDEPDISDDPDKTKITVNKSNMSELMKKQGISGTVVTTAEELENALATSKSGDKIVVLGKMSFNNQELTAQNVTISGVEALLRDTGTSDKFSVSESSKAVLEFSVKGTANNNAITIKDNTVISDLTISYQTEKKVNGIINKVFNVQGNGNIFNNINLNATTPSNGNDSSFIVGIYSSGNAVLKGEINVNFNAETTKLFNGSYYGALTQEAGSHLNVTMKGSSHAVFDGGKVTLNGTTNVYMSGRQGNFMNFGNNVINGKVSIDADISVNNQFTLISETNIAFKSAADISFKLNTPDFRVINKNSQAGQNSWENGAKISYNDKIWIAHAGSMSGNFVIDNNKGSTLGDIWGWSAVNLRSRSIEKPLAASLFENMLDFYTEKVETASPLSLQNSENRFNSIVSYYDDLIKSNYYRGVNLLLGDNLTVDFSADRTSKLKINGFDARSQTLGLTTAKWENSHDINKSLQEIRGALAQLRQEAAELGNFNNIINKRQDFTKNFINILNEGADLLTLADINEEAASMLSLQTRQKLAVNALSLAAQSNRSVLKLF